MTLKPNIFSDVALPRRRCRPKPRSFGAHIPALETRCSSVVYLTLQGIVAWAVRRNNKQVKEGIVQVSVANSLRSQEACVPMYLLNVGCD
jgi:hypothetical protein